MREPAKAHAYPYTNLFGDSVPGMTLRDYFAGQALAGMHARDGYDAGQSTPEKRARLCYADADAMLAERDKEKT